MKSAMSGSVVVTSRRTTVVLLPSADIFHVETAFSVSRASRALSRAVGPVIHGNCRASCRFVGTLLSYRDLQKTRPAWKSVSRDLQRERERGPTWRIPEIQSQHSQPHMTKSFHAKTTPHCCCCCCCCFGGGGGWGGACGDVPPRALRDEGLL